MQFIDEQKEAIIILSGRVARELLRRGYTIIDVKPDKKNKIKSVFVFKFENNIDRVLADIVYSDNTFAEHSN